MEQPATDRGPALVGDAYLLTGDLHAAQDLVPEALIRTFSKRRPDDVEFLEAYVRRAVDAWAITEGERTIVFEIAANPDGQESWSHGELGRVVAIAVLSGIPYDISAWGDEKCD